jgi:hypothetical protein
LLILGVNHAPLVKVVTNWLNQFNTILSTSIMHSGNVNHLHVHEQMFFTRTITLHVVNVSSITLTQWLYIYNAFR